MIEESGSYSVFGSTYCSTSSSKNSDLRRVICAAISDDGHFIFTGRLCDGIHFVKMFYQEAQTPGPIFMFGE